MAAAPMDQQAWAAEATEEAVHEADKKPLVTEETKQNTGKRANAGDVKMEAAEGEGEPEADQPNKKADVSINTQIIDVDLAEAEALDSQETLRPDELPDHGWEVGMYFSVHHKHFKNMMCPFHGRKSCQFQHKMYTGHPGDPASNYVNLNLMGKSYLLLENHQILQIWAGWQHVSTEDASHRHRDAFVAALIDLPEGQQAWTNLARLSTHSEMAYWIHWATETDSRGARVDFNY